MFFFIGTTCIVNLIKSIMKIKPLLLLAPLIIISHSISAQKSRKGSDELITITGKVFTYDHKPVEGAFFFTDNFETTYKSKSNGSYKIKVSASTKKLSVRSIDYGVCDTILNGVTTINFTLPGSSKSVKQNTAISEEKINIGYGTADKKTMTGSVSKINGSPSKYASYQNVYEMLSGTVPGVQVNGKSIIIRGQSTFNAGSQPLFVVDGIIVSSIDGIIPREIKSIEVLKGPDAAIYGVQGANGVISITTFNSSNKNQYDYQQS
jgi:TonB-dependent SusC/RagA subfamily outer membrane receptor